MATSPPSKGSRADELPSPLHGVTVVEAASYVAGPFASFMLAQLGADVIKVEPPGGDPLRRFGVTRGDVSALWVNLNQGKHLLRLDLKSEKGHRDMLEQLRTADVFLHNWRPGKAASLKLDTSHLSAHNPALITVAITGFGESGPKATSPVFDLLLQAASGLAVSESTSEGPRSLRSLIADKTTAAFAVQAILAALISRAATGKGTHIDLAMLDVMAYYDFPDLCQDRTFLSPDAKVNLERGRSGLLHTSDGYVAVAPSSGRQISGALATVGHSEWKDDLKRTSSPVALSDLLYERLESVTISRPTAEWEKSFLAHDVPATGVMSIDQHLTDKQTVHNELYDEVESLAGPLRRVRYPARLNGKTLTSLSGWWG